MTLAKVKTELKKSATGVYAKVVKPLFWFLVIGLGGLYLLWLIIYEFSPTAKQIEWDYRIDVSHIEVAPKPHDCEFMSAPIGEKHCHYDQYLSLVNARGEFVGGDTVSDDGKHIKTQPKEQATSAYVNWVKVKE